MYIKYTNTKETLYATVKRAVITNHMEYSKKVNLRVSYILMHSMYISVCICVNVLNFHYTVFIKTYSTHRERNVDILCCNEDMVEYA